MYRVGGGGGRSTRLVGGTGRSSRLLVGVSWIGGFDWLSASDEEVVSSVDFEPSVDDAETSPPSSWSGWPRKWPFPPPPAREAMAVGVVTLT